MQERVDQRVLVVEGRGAYRGEVVQPFAEPGGRGGEGGDVLAAECPQRARVGGDLGDGGVGEALHLLAAAERSRSGPVRPRVPLERDVTSPPAGRTAPTSPGNTR